MSAVVTTLTDNEIDPYSTNEENPINKYYKIQNFDVCF
jgi:hypothetical protein